MLKSGAGLLEIVGIVCMENYDLIEWQVKLGDFSPLASPCFDAYVLFIAEVTYIASYTVAKLLMFQWLSKMMSSTFYLNAEHSLSSNTYKSLLFYIMYSILCIHSWLAGYKIIMNLATFNDSFVGAVASTSSPLYKSNNKYCHIYSL